METVETLVNILGITCLQELYKLFDWHVYQSEQAQATATSVLEHNLHQTHKNHHANSIDTHKFLSKDGTTETLLPDLHYTIEKHMPLAKTPCLDLYFTPSKFLTFSLLLTACVGYICKCDSEYCLISLTRHPLNAVTEPTISDSDEKRMKRQKRDHERS